MRRLPTCLRTSGRKVDERIGDRLLLGFQGSIVGKGRLIVAASTSESEIFSKISTNQTQESTWLHNTCHCGVYFCVPLTILFLMHRTLVTWTLNYRQKLPIGTFVQLTFLRIVPLASDGIKNVDEVFPLCLHAVWTKHETRTINFETVE